MSAMPSGPRANAGAAQSMLAAPNMIAAPIRRRRRLTAGLAAVISASLQRVDLRSTVRPNRPAAQAFEPDISAKNRPKTGNDSVDSQRDFLPTRHCEPPGRANARPMINSAKQSIVPSKERMDCFVASLLAMTE